VARELRVNGHTAIAGGRCLDAGFMPPPSSLSIAGSPVRLRIGLTFVRFGLSDFQTFGLSDFRDEEEGEGEGTRWRYDVVRIDMIAFAYESYVAGRNDRSVDALWL
jgi:hypothetical protein